MVSYSILIFVWLFIPHTSDFVIIIDCSFIWLQHTLSLKLVLSLCVKYLFIYIFDFVFGFLWNVKWFYLVSQFCFHALAQVIIYRRDINSRVLVTEFRFDLDVVSYNLFGADLRTSVAYILLLEVASCAYYCQLIGFYSERSLLIFLSLFSLDSWFLLYRQ